MKETHSSNMSILSKYAFLFVISFSLIFGIHIGKLSAMETCVEDSFSGMIFLMPDSSEKLTAHHMTHWFPLVRGKNIGSGLYLKYRTYENLNPIYLGGYSLKKPDTMDQIYCNGHILAFSANGKTKTPEMLLSYIRDILTKNGNGRFCKEIRDIIIDGKNGKFFEVNYLGKSGYTSWKEKGWVYLAVLSDNRGYGVYPEFDKIDNPPSAKRPVGQFLQSKELKSGCFINSIFSR